MLRIYSGDKQNTDESTECFYIKIVSTKLIYCGIYFVVVSILVR